MQNNVGSAASWQLMKRFDDGQWPMVKVALYCVAFAIFYIFCAGHFDHNDFMYSASAAAHGNLYNEVHFVQAPLSYYAIKSINFAAGPHSHYYWLRFASVAFAFSAIVVAAEFCLSRNISKIGMVFVSATNYHYAISASEIGSYALPMLLTSCAFAALLRTARVPAFSYICGTLIGLATSAKLNYFFFILPAAFSVIAFRRHKGDDDALPAIFHLMAGFVIGLSPILFKIAQNGHSFWAHNIWFHSNFTADFRHLSTIDTLKSVASEFSHWLDRGGVYLLLLISWVISRGMKSKSVQGSNLVLASAFLVAALASATSPMVGFAQYYMPVSFFASLCGLLALEHAQKTESQQHLIAIRMVMVAIFAQQLIHITPGLYNSIRQGSAMAEIGRINSQVANALIAHAQGSCKREIFTLSGSFVLDAGLSPSRYMEGGPFWSRLNGHIPDRYLIELTYAIDPLLLDPSKHIRQDQGLGAVMVGYYADKPEIGEDQIKLAAEETGFERIASISTWLSKHPLELWIRPACLPSTDDSRTPGTGSS